MLSKSALGLLADYGGDSSDEEVPGSRVSTKRMYRDDEEEPQNKRFERLPVPQFMSTTPEEVVDDPSLHDGRTRSFPHERGNWATHIYIALQSNEALNVLLCKIANCIPEDIGMKYFEEFHISLTRTVILKHHWIHPFIDTVKENLAYFTKFIVMFSYLDVYCNEEKTRTFLALQTKTGIDSLLQLVHSLNHCLGDFKLPRFYEKPSFHMSLAWCVGDCTERLQSFLQSLNRDLEALMTEYSQENWYIYVEKIMCRSGNKVFQFELR